MIIWSWRGIRVRSKTSSTMSWGGGGGGGPHCRNNIIYYYIVQDDDDDVELYLYMLYYRGLVYEP